MVLQLRTAVFGVVFPALFSLIIPTFMRMYAILEKQSYTLQVVNSQGIEENNEFDFIVVGAGSAGCVLANRLSKHFSVLLLERGGEPNPWTNIPLNSITLCRNPDVDYMYKVKPQTASCLGLNDHSCAWPRGKGLGGSSNINWQIYLRGHPLDYDNWANISGDERWQYKNIFPFFTKSEDYCIQCEDRDGDEATFNPLFHNKNGFLTVGKVSSRPLVEEFLQANEWDGIMRTDLNAPYFEGCAPIVQTKRLGRRCSTKVAFLDPIRHRKTLTIQKYARAYKLLFRESNEVYGIEYEHVGFQKTAYASKEVIVSTGAIETPKLLMLSGIGPKHHLESLGIPVLKDSPVGTNLQDHLGTYVGPFLIDKGKSLLPERDIAVLSLLEYIVQGTGHLTQTGVHAISMFTSSIAKNRDQALWPDIQFLFSGVGTTPMWNTVFPKSFEFQEGPINDFFGPVNNRDAFSILVFNERPRSRGEITLASTDYRVDPIIDPKYYMDPIQVDIQTMVEGIKRAVYISENAPSFKRLNAQLSTVPYPLCSMFTLRSDDYWECLARHFSFNNFHYVGTVPMGKENSPNAVVDSELRVIGTKRLRVIDGSIMPDIVSVNTNAPVIMVAERGAQFILDTYLT